MYIVYIKQVFLSQVVTVPHTVRERIRFFFFFTRYWITSRRYLVEINAGNRIAREVSPVTDCWGHADTVIVKKDMMWFRFKRAANRAAWREWLRPLFDYTDSVGDWSSTACLINWTLVRIFFWCPANITPILWRSLENTHKNRHRYQFREEKLINVQFRGTVDKIFLELDDKTKVQ